VITGAFVLFFFFVTVLIVSRFYIGVTEACVVSYLDINTSFDTYWFLLESVWSAFWSTRWYVSVCLRHTCTLTKRIQKSSM